MAKKLHLFIYCLFMIVYTQAQIILSEDFNSGFPVNWQSVDVDGLTPVPQTAFCGVAFGMHIDNDSTNTSDSVVVATSWFTPVGMANNYLITPSITLLANGNFLTWQAKSYDPSYPDGYMILVSTTTAAMAAFTDTIYNTNAEVPYWINRQLNLDAYAGQTIYLAFRHYANNKFILALDNIEVFADITYSIEEPLTNNKILVFPNPSQGNITIQPVDLQLSVNRYSIIIQDISGKIVYSETPACTNHSISLNLEYLQNGIYYLLIQTEGGMAHKKIIIAK